MKKMILFVLVLFASSFIYSQTVSEPIQNPVVPFRLFRTSNMWTFIQLDTASGRLWQVQFSVQDDGRGCVPINERKLAEGEDEIIGRFTLYPTANNWTFILLDQISGSSWQVQWSFDNDKRFIVPLVSN